MVDVSSVVQEVGMMFYIVNPRKFMYQGNDPDVV